jgi:hypothetical protein
MGSFGDYLELELLDHLTGVGAFAMPTHLWVGLFTITPADAGGGTEVSAGGYGRVDHTPGGTNWNTAATGSTSNKTAIAFSAPTANWGVIVAFGVFDAETAGNLLWWGAVTPNKTINNGDAAPSFAAGALTLTLD